MSTTSLISAAAATLAVESSWCQFAIARKADGQPCGPLSPLATQWDLGGAMEKALAAQSLPRSDFNAVMALTSGILRGTLGLSSTDIDAFNDSSTHAELLTFLDQLGDAA